MVDRLLKETFLYGNLHISYTCEEIKRLDVRDLKRCLSLFGEDEIDISCVWRMYNNFRILFNDRNVDILNDIEKYKIIISTFSDYIEKVEKHFGLSDRFINVEPSTVQDHFKITVYCILSELANIISPSKIKSLKELYNNLFSSYLPFIKNQTIFCDFRSPPVSKRQKINWSPSWKLVYDDDQIYLTGIDCYLDTYFYNTNFVYGKGMNDDLDLLTSRVGYLKIKAQKYYEKGIKPNLRTVSKKIFNTFPYQIIYARYPLFIEIDKEVYTPPIMGWKEGVGWMLSIIPLYVTAFLLGFPVISSDIPSPKNVIPRIRKLVEGGIEEYIEDVRKRNRMYIQSKSFDTHIANEKDEDDDYIDLTLEKVVDFNMDDTLIFYNSGVIHLFTSHEFGELIKKQINPYNRNEIPKDLPSTILGRYRVRSQTPNDIIPLISILSRNEDYKNDIKKGLSRRGLRVEFKSTMENNIEELMTCIVDEDIPEIAGQEPRLGYDVHERSIFGHILQAYRSMT